MTSVPVLSQALLTYFLLPSSFYPIYFCQALTIRTTLQVSVSKIRQKPVRLAG